MQLELFTQNKMEEGICYLQITRGATNRVPTCPKGLQPTISATVALGKKLTPEEFEKGVSVITHEDIRWKRCDIKTVGLLGGSRSTTKHPSTFLSTLLLPAAHSDTALKSSLVSLTNFAPIANDALTTAFCATAALLWLQIWITVTHQF
jgi:hypothetical protein